jgi:hypothetical protein
MSQTQTWSYSFCPCHVVVATLAFITVMFDASCILYFSLDEAFTPSPHGLLILAWDGMVGRAAVALHHLDFPSGIVHVFTCIGQGHLLHLDHIPHYQHMRLCNSQRIYDLAARNGMSFDRSCRSRRWKLFPRGPLVPRNGPSCGEHGSRVCN